ncbi:S-layer homology domain-containing protein [Lachnoclostridium phytofermentans]|uniref:SLH domain-containing protein n=1 Tax=Lachnoclostridium phytofermentans (strain ATCC 700394 / DSM 18823 / ISDg) TaxID=357809 RepID=A9KKR0_LACP7|nr:S-layer homology domain-containing protein [Lachnoclostridium phytofermentans]ABX41231.1 hypothetical protein Cphy_0844 [Lachnoclostridium phytofermentans ISDg]
MKIVKKDYRIVLLCIILLLSIVFEKTLVVQASTNYITRGYFIKLVCQEIGITAKGTTNQAYINAAIENGIIAQNTFSDYERNVSKMDAAVILVNAHESLYGNTLSEDLIQTIFEKRITDINKIPEYRQIPFAKAYAYGYIKGSSDGSYTTSSTFNPTQKISKATALSFISMLKVENMRSRITEDGQLIRTTNLPKFAEFYSYILASYPNAFYDWEFGFMKNYHTRYQDGKPYEEYLYETGEYKDGINFAYPATVKNYKKDQLMYTLLDGTKTNYEGMINDAWLTWEKNIEEYLWNVFNVDYRTIEKNKQWYNAVTMTSIYYKSNKTYLDNYINEYISLAKKNKTIIECDKIAFDKSGIYKNSNGTYIRVYVHYKIKSSINNKQVLLSPLAFTFERYPNFLNVKLYEWRNGYFDLVLLPDGSIDSGIFNDYFHDVNVLGR